MLISNPAPSDSVLTKKIPKKPILNREILEEIFVKIMTGNSYMCSWSDSRKEKNIEIFMASGRQPFNIALNYFTRVNRVEIGSNIIFLHMNDEDICCFTFGFFAFLKPVLYAIGPSIKHFFSFEDPVGAYVDMIFDALIHEGIEHVCVRKNIPEKSLSKLCQITSIISGPFTYSHLPLIRSKSPAFGFDTDFKELIKEKPENFSMPWVKDLLISSNYELSDFTAESVEYFVKCISEIFPNIEELYIEFKPSNPTWKSAYGIMKILEPHLFKSIPLSVKGGIEMVLYLEEMESLNEIDKLTEGDNEYVFGRFIASKTFEIHEGFTADLFMRY
uniref:Uncharacterized protein n=1 Tax=Panagrolaimus sp. PS1159 TaxID=55785 RepID=A0AC35FUW5_9BILA